MGQGKGMGAADGRALIGFGDSKLEGEPLIDVMLEIGIKAVAFIGCGFSIGCLIAWRCEEREWKLNKEDGE